MFSSEGYSLLNCLSSFAQANRVYQSCWGHFKNFVKDLKIKDKAEQWGV